MEDRKRPAANADDVAPPSKRQAVNGTSKSKDDSNDSREEAWIEEYQKGAIYRQMLEYKRSKVDLEHRLQEAEKSAAFHDDHLRVIKYWLSQLTQELELIVEGSLKSIALKPADSNWVSSLAFKDSKEFRQHLDDIKKPVILKVESLLNKLASSRGEVKPDVAQLEAQVKSLLANQKELAVKIDRLQAENATLSEQYDTATLKVIKAERKLDRVRSAQVQKLEQQALANSTTRQTTNDENGTGSIAENGDGAEYKTKYKEAIAVANKQKEQIESLLAEIKTLQEENASFKIKKEGISEEDYARTDVFKQFKAQNEDLIKRINNLEAVNKQFREDAEKLRAERTSYRATLEQEAQALTSDLEDQIQQKDQDLTRIRSARDELLAELAMRKASQEQEKTASAHLNELVEAMTDRITQLESELERLRPTEDAAKAAPTEDLSTLSAEELREKFAKLERDYEAINKELPALEKSYRKAMGIAHKKVMDFTALEERVAILTAEKSKADQKYFAARKDMDIRIAEIRTLRGQNSKSSEIISQLKDVETQHRALITTLEKQIADLKQSNITIVTESKKLESLSSEATRRADSVKSQIENLQNLVKSKDTAGRELKEKAMDKEQEAEKLKVRLDKVSSERDKWKTKCQSNSTEEEEMLRNLVLCSVCRSNFKNTILKGCGHVFCNECVDNRLANRMRKCPSCNKAFDRSDAMPAHL
ncbi:E3 ubiquitin-protein ligase bre-1 [Neurospora tetrasperma FGSC 2508]|uniref:E3 ubiquitin protein ligase n=1 Tax=Neurospora tetrasperma (strain FGSC 2508 / ATCC MYA-4615 / P0657) TaxID=510951 RepID=F8MKR5_NEUT8|nr:E3 ubiquitin-protein ligase bre-1 [Neurospora tetrasperma FGSC 2508]EGO58293.1 E3 ubiquitin-protein ligase bre-1 [Neurospora tetrasperma FGSC 2508]EGZ71389.1 E3 ubiquitin-protein ligase bre-1 [Neurospora tetrasperma FGSC 2509]